MIETNRIGLLPAIKLLGNVNSGRAVFVVKHQLSCFVEHMNNRATTTVQ